MTARKLEGQYAGFLSRAVGALIDYLILIAIVVGTGLLTIALLRAFDIDLNSCSRDNLACTAGRGFLLGFGMLASPVYFTLFWMLVGQTMGQRVMGVRVVRLNGHRMGFWSSLLRWLGYQLCLATLGIGYLWVLVDDRRMGWHDKLARTCVIYSWKAVQNQRLVRTMDSQLRGIGAEAEPAEAAQAAPSTSVT
jgi:uncharacterized RDD family membrane protein YckC